MTDIWFASDMHFGHRNIIDYCSRPWATVEEMDEALVENWNAVVKPMDQVYHLGDWAFHSYERIGQLNGRITSVPGNHDHERRKKLEPFLSGGFTEEVFYLKIDPERRFVLSHYPFEAWRREYRYHLHGHMHGYGNEAPNRLDVGIDAHKLYRPLNLDEIMQALKLGSLWNQALKG